MSVKRKVTKEGIRFEGRVYWDNTLLQYVGQQVQVFLGQVSADDSSLCVFHDGKLICSAKEKKGEVAMLGFGKKLGDYKTDELIKELAQRAGVSKLKLNDQQMYQVKSAQKRIKECGPATVLVIREQ